MFILATTKNKHFPNKNRLSVIFTSSDSTLLLFTLAHNCTLAHKYKIYQSQNNNDVNIFLQTNNIEIE